MTRRSALVAGGVVTVLGFVVLGLAVGWLWAQIAIPARFTVTPDNAVMDEVEAGRQFGVTVTYAWLSAAAALLWTLLCGLRFVDVGWPLVPLTVLGASLAAILAWRLGVALGPGDATTAIKGADVGDTVPQSLMLDSHGVLFVWPVVSLVALIAVTWWATSPGDRTRAPLDS